jgi:hypothetical protein
MSLSAVELKEVDQRLKEAKQLCKKANEAMAEWLILVNIYRQKLYLLDKGELDRDYLISTAQNGVGQEEGSGKTPLGLHYVQLKIGEGADPFAVFKSRELTGDLAVPVARGDAIIGRILWLAGLELGFNLGENSEGTVVDSSSRYIYIHGTNDIDRIGQARSSGCIRMKPYDVIDLFNKAPEGTLVYIYEN